MFSLHTLKIVSGPIIGLLVFLAMQYFTQNILISKAAGVAVWIAIWWITEAVNIYFTAFLPLSLFPILGIMDMKEVAPMYTNEIIFLFIGGFLIAFAIEKWNLHKRIALKILLFVGTSPSKVLLGFMLCSYLLSMWISNIATTMMLLPAVLAVVKQFDELPYQKKDNKIAIALLLGLAHGATIGGTATLVGTAPNMIFSSFYNSAFPQNVQVNFTNWLLFAIPVSAVFFVCGYFILKKMFLDNLELPNLNTEKYQDEYSQLGKMKFEEKITLSVFVITVFLWFFRTDIQLGNLNIPGWSSLFPYSKYIKDSTVAMIMASIMFLVPSKKQGMILTWEEAKKIPVGIMFLFGGGFALASGIEVSGLSGWLADSLIITKNLSPFYIVLILCIFTVLLSEFASNTATTYLVMPIVVALSKTVDSHPLLLMIPVVFSASYAFMLPVATPPNTVVYGTELISAKSMMKAGLILNITGMTIVILAIFTLGKWVFGY